MYFTFCKNRMLVVVAVMLSAFIGCARKNNSSVVLKSELLSPLDQARLSYEHGEYYKSRLQVQELLNQDPENTAAQQLMADVLDKEIERQKEAVAGIRQEASKSESETLNDANQIEVKNWLERSRTLLRQRQYDLALFAAEKVFIYEPNNREASFLIDDIKGEAIKNGKSESLFLSKMYQEEIGERVKKYRNEAQALASDNKDEQAKFTLQKILLLEPEDPEALSLMKSLQSKEVRA